MVSMRSTLAKVLVGVCGGIAFAFLNRITISVSGPKWWLALGLAFAVCFLVAAAVESYRNRGEGRRKKQVVGSRNKSAGNQDIDVGTVSRAGDDGDIAVGSGNVSKGDQKIKIDQAQL
jgi:hypothetical protein